jgi:hypothetical protein
MISVDEAAQILGVSPRRVRVLCNQDRILGAKLISGVWVLPPKPEVIPAERSRPGKLRLKETD